MYKLLIVDDEPLVREGLKDSIEWGKYGYVIVGEASNGIEAIDKIRQLTPDVVITDMRMGVMDGSNLISFIKKLYPRIQIIILTAYNEFSYAKVAIDHNVFSYISKPALNEQIISVFCQLKEKMDHDIQTTNDLNAYYSYRTEILLTRLLQAQEPAASDIEEITKLLPLLGSGAEYYLALLEIDTRSNPALDTQERNLSHILRERLDLLINSNDCFLEKAALSATQTALILSAGKARVLQELTGLLHSCCDDFIYPAQAALTISISTAFQDLSSIHHAYIQAQKALKQKMQYGYGTIIDYMAIRDFHQMTPPVFSNQDIERIIKQLKSADERDLYLTITHHFDSLKKMNTDISIVKLSAEDLITEIVLQIFKTQYTMQLILGKRYNPVSDINTLNSLIEIQSYLFNIFEKTVLYTRIMKDLSLETDQYSPLIQKAIMFIMSNYMNSISILDIASALHISESRFAHCFKDATGKSFITFLTEYRIYLAKAMIISGQYKLNEISDLVGYKNPITFRKAFSKITGTIPSKYLT